MKIFFIRNNDHCHWFLTSLRGAFLDHGSVFMICLLNLKLVFKPFVKRQNYSLTIFLKSFGVKNMLENIKGKHSIAHKFNFELKTFFTVHSEFILHFFVLFKNLIWNMFLFLFPCAIGKLRWGRKDKLSCAQTKTRTLPKSTAEEMATTATSSVAATATATAATSTTTTTATYKIKRKVFAG